jgi:REP element-mobilizing transposase RayT
MILNPLWIFWFGSRETALDRARDYALCRDLLAEAAAGAGSEIWCYCPIPNHVHVIVVPADEDGLRRTFADASALHGLRQRAPPLDRSPLAGAVRRGGDG